MASWWINFFKDLVDKGIVDLEKELHKECLWFCFSGVMDRAQKRLIGGWQMTSMRRIFVLRLCTSVTSKGCKSEFQEFFVL